jgi:hypothetical protein
MKSTEFITEQQLEREKIQEMGIGGTGAGGMSVVSTAMPGMKRRTMPKKKAKK